MKDVNRNQWILAFCDKKGEPPLVHVPIPTEKIWLYPIMRAYCLNCGRYIRYTEIAPGTEPRWLQAAPVVIEEWP